MNQFRITDYVENVVANRTDHDRLLQKIGEVSERRNISVTDLVSPRQAYYARKNPEIPHTMEAKERMMAGSGFHDIFGKLMSNKEYLEQYVEREAIAGRIDIYEDIPIELKTTTLLGTIENIQIEKPEYFEQLGMYCAIIEKNKGIVIVKITDSTPGSSQYFLKAYDVTFDNLDDILNDMKIRRNQLQDALDGDDPSSLPKCKWNCDTCQYNMICDYNDAPTEIEFTIAKLAGVTENPTLASEVLEKLRTYEKRKQSSSIRQNDLITPRKTYFKAISEIEPSSDNQNTEPLEWMTRWGKVRGIEQAIFRRTSKKPGESANIPFPEDYELTGYIHTWNGEPAIFNLSKLTNIVELKDMKRLFSWQIESLAIQCALLGRTRGKLFVSYDKLQGDLAKMRAYDIYFKDIEKIKLEYVSRINQLKRAIENNDLSELPYCPTWMCTRCEYNGTCLKPSGALKPFKKG